MRSVGCVHAACIAGNARHQQRRLPHKQRRRMREPDFCLVWPRQPTTSMSHRSCRSSRGARMRRRGVMPRRQQTRKPSGHLLAEVAKALLGAPPCRQQAGCHPRCLHPAGEAMECTVRGGWGLSYSRLASGPRLHPPGPAAPPPQPTACSRPAAAGGSAPTAGCMAPAPAGPQLPPLGCPRMPQCGSRRRCPVNQSPGSLPPGCPG